MNRRIYLNNKKLSISKKLSEHDKLFFDVVRHKTGIYQSTVTVNTKSGVGLFTQKESSNFFTSINMAYKAINNQITKIKSKKKFLSLKTFNNSQEAS